MNEVGKHLKLTEKMGFGALSTAINIVFQFKSLYYLFFLTNVLGMNVFYAGIIFTIGTVWDAINDPLFGFWAVNHKFKNGESCRPFALWASLPLGLTTILLFTNFGFVLTAQKIIALVVYIVFEIFNTFVAIPYNSMAGLATNVDASRRSINVFRNLGGCLGSGIGAVACLPLLRVFGALDGRGNIKPESGSRGFFLVASLMGVIVVAGCLVHYFTTKERVKPLVEKEEKISARAAAKMLFGSRSWVMNMFYIICYGVTNLLLMSCVAYYATYVLGSTAAATPIQAAYLVVMILSSFLVPPIDKLLGRRRTMMLGAAIAIVGKLWFVINPFSLGAIYVNSLTVGVAVTIAFVLFNTNRNNIVDIIEWKEGRRLDSLVSTADNLASKLAVAGATQLVTISMALAGYNAALPVQPKAAIDAINFMLGWAPLIVAIVMLVVAYFHTVEKDLTGMQAQKAAGNSM